MTEILSTDLQTYVALAESLPDAGLACGQVGAIVAKWPSDTFEVEFLDGDGEVCAVVLLADRQLAALDQALNWDRSQPPLCPAAAPSSDGAVAPASPGAHVELTCY